MAFADIVCMNTYPIELRQRVVDAVDSNVGTKKEIAKTFSVSVSWIRKLLQRRRETDSIEPLPRTQGRKPAFGGHRLQELKDFVERHPDATLEEIREFFADRVNCSIVAVHNALKRLDWRYKKNRYMRASKTERT